MKRMRNTMKICLVFVFLLFFAESAWSLNFNPGQYDITSTIQMPSIPGMSMPPQSTTVNQCLAENDTIPQKVMAIDGCQVENQQISGNTVSWNMKCVQQGLTTTGNCSMTYNGDSFSGEFQINMGPQTGNMVMTTQISGQRTGPCQQ